MRSERTWSYQLHEHAPLWHHSLGHGSFPFLPPSPTDKIIIPPPLADMLS